MAPKASTTTALNEAATKTRETISEAKEMLMQQADEAGANVTSLQLAERLRDRARKLVAYNDANKPTAELMFAKADEVAGEGQTYSVMDMQRKANITGELAGNWTASKAANKSEQEFVRAMRDTADDAVESALLGVPPSEVSTMVSRLRGSPAPKGAKDLYQELRKAEQVARLVEEQTAESLSRAAGGRLVGLREAEVAKGAGGAAGSMGLPAAPAAAAAVGGFKAMSARAAQARASGKETAAALGERLGNLSRAAEAPASAASARAAGAITSAVRGAGEAKYRAPMSPDDVALADDLRRRGVPEDEIASILGLNQRALALDELR
jgi:predicted transcriptional regulator